MNACLTLRAFANCAPKLYYFADGDGFCHPEQSDPSFTCLSNEQKNNFFVGD